MINLPPNYAVIDLETTGLNAEAHKIIEIGVKVVKDHQPQPVESILINWPGLVVPSVIAGITGITTELLEKDGVPPADALSWFHSRAGSLPLAGHNIIKFDRPFLHNAIEDWDRSVSLRRIGDYIDTAGLFKALITNEPRRPGEQTSVWMLRVLGLRYYGAKFSLSAACDHYNVQKHQPEHRAAADVESCYEVLQHLAKEWW